MPLCILRYDHSHCSHNIKVPVVPFLGLVLSSTGEHRQLESTVSLDSWQKGLLSFEKESFQSTTLRLFSLVCSIWPPGDLFIRAHLPQEAVGKSLTVSQSSSRACWRRHSQTAFYLFMFWVERSWWANLYEPQLPNQQIADAMQFLFPSFNELFTILTSILE